MYSTAAYCQHQHKQERPKRLGCLGLVFPVDPHPAGLLFVDIFACCYLGETRHIGEVCELFWWEEHTCLYHAYLLILLIFWSTSCLWNYMEFSFFLFFREKGWERHGTWKNHSRHTDILHPVPHPCCRPQVCWDRKIQYNCFSLNSVLIIPLHIILNFKWSFRAFQCFVLLFPKSDPGCR